MSARRESVVCGVEVIVTIKDRVISAILRSVKKKSGWDKENETSRREKVPQVVWESLLFLLSS